MSRPSRVGASMTIVAIACAGACSRGRCTHASDAVTSDPVDARDQTSLDARADAAPMPAFTSDLRGKKLVHRFGDARSNRGALTLRLSTDPARCTSTDEQPGRTIVLTVPAGPDGAPLAGHAINVSVTMLPEPEVVDDGMNFGATAATLTLDPLSLEIGARVRGTLRFDDEAKPDARHAGEGAFEVPLCGDEDHPPQKSSAVDPTLLAAPLSGTVGGAPFHPRTALGVHYRVYAQTFVDGIYFFEDAGVTCASTNGEHVPGRWVELWDVGGTVESRPLSGAQVAASTVGPRGDAGTEESTNHGFAWIEWTELAEGHVRGRAHATNEPMWDGTVYAFEVDGTFDVTVCR